MESSLLSVPTVSQRSVNFPFGHTMAVIAKHEQSVTPVIVDLDVIGVGIVCVFE